VIPNVPSGVGYVYDNMKGTIYANRLPRGKQVRKVWEPLPVIPNVPSGVGYAYGNMKGTVYGGNAVAQWLRCCAKNRKVGGSIPTGVSGSFH